MKSRKKTAEAVILFSHCYSADRLFQLDIVNSSNAQQVCPGQKKADLRQDAEYPPVASVLEYFPQNT